MTLTLEQVEEMKTAGGYLDLRGTGITALPEGLTVGGYLDLEGCTGITALPEGLTVGGSLDLRGTGITALPEGLTVGGSLDLRGTGITDADARKVKRFSNGDCVPGKYIYCDGILTHNKCVKKAGIYTLYVGRIPGKNVVSDGVHFAHCDKLREGISDLAFKAATDRGADQYKNLTLDTELTVPEMVTMYRIITGACRQGSESFVNGLGKLKDRYTVREAIDLTKGQYNADRFAEFFGGSHGTD